MGQNKIYLPWGANTSTLLKGFFFFWYCYSNWVKFQPSTPSSNNFWPGSFIYQTLLWRYCKEKPACPALTIPNAELMRFLFGICETRHQRREGGESRVVGQRSGAGPQDQLIRSPFRDWHKHVMRVWCLVTGTNYFSWGLGCHWARMDKGWSVGCFEKSIDLVP